jgi:hypothetical protein
MATSQAAGTAPTDVTFTTEQCSKRASKCRCNVSELLLFLNFTPFAIILTVYSCFDFKKNTGTYRFTFRTVKLTMYCCSVGRNAVKWEKRELLPVCDHVKRKEIYLETEEIIDLEVNKLVLGQRH